MNPKQSYIIDAIASNLAKYSLTGGRVFAFLHLILLLGCNGVGPTLTDSSSRTIDETSEVRPALEDRITRLEKYVTFEREYAALEYDLFYVDASSGLVPGPSEWDIQILAVIPPEEIEQWIPTDVQAIQQQPPKWVDEIPGDITTAGILEWYFDGSKSVGIDRENSTVAYRLSTLATVED